MFQDLELSVRSLNVTKSNMAYNLTDSEIINLKIT